jgi:hypothetical protein
MDASAVPTSLFAPVGYFAGSSYSQLCSSWQDTFSTENGNSNAILIVWKLQGPVFS